MSTVRLPKLKSRPPASHELASVQKNHKDGGSVSNRSPRKSDRKQEKKQDRNSRDQRPTTPVERLRDLGMNRLLTPELLASTGFAYINPVHCPDAETHMDLTTSVKKKGKRSKKDEERKKKKESLKGDNTGLLTDKETKVDV